MASRDPPRSAARDLAVRLGLRLPDQWCCRRRNGVRPTGPRPEPAECCHHPGCSDGDRRCPGVSARVRARHHRHGCRRQDCRSETEGTMSLPETDLAQPGLASRPTATRPGARVTVGEVVAIGVLALLALAAIVPGLFTSVDPLAISPTEAFQSPNTAHWFGTDESGRDVFARTIHGARSSLLIGVAATAIGMALALILGVMGGIGAKPLDYTVTRVGEVLFALPGLLLALVFIAIVGPGMMTATVAVGISTAPGYARIIRSQIRAVRTAPFVEAATVLGRSRFFTLRRHILPNALAPIFVLATLGVGQAIVWASSLSYLGLGAVPPAAEWGAMLSAGRSYISNAWWLTVFPGLFIVLAAGAATALGRSLQARTRQVQQ